MNAPLLAVGDLSTEFKTDHGRFRAVDAAAWARTYTALLDGLAMHVVLHPRSQTPARMRAAIREHVDDLLAA